MPRLCFSFLIVVALLSGSACSTVRSRWRLSVEADDPYSIQSERIWYSVETHLPLESVTCGLRIRDDNWLTTSYGPMLLPVRTHSHNTDKFKAKAVAFELWIIPPEDDAELVINRSQLAIVTDSGQRVEPSEIIFYEAFGELEKAGSRIRDWDKGDGVLKTRGGIVCQLEYAQAKLSGLSSFQYQPRFQLGGKAFQGPVWSYSVEGESLIAWLDIPFAVR